MPSKKIAGILIAIKPFQIQSILDDCKAKDVQVTIRKNSSAKVKKLLDKGYGVIVLADDTPRLTVYLQDEDSEA